MAIFIHPFQVFNKKKGNCNIFMIRMCEIDIGNLKARNFTKLVPVRNFYSPFWVYRFFDMRRARERHTQSFSADYLYIVSSQSNQRAAPVAHKVVWPRPALNVDSLVRRQELNKLLFFQIPKSSAHAPGAWSHSHLLVPIPIRDFYFDISEWHILSQRAWTPALMLHLTNPCAQR